MYGTARPLTDDATAALAAEKHVQRLSLDWPDAAFIGIRRQLDMLLGRFIDRHNNTQHIRYFYRVRQGAVCACARILVRGGE